MSTLTPIQNQVIALLADGYSVTVAAAQLDLHRTTIHHWKRTNPDFANALADAKEDAADTFQSACRQHGALIITALVALINDPKASPSVRLKAALTLMNGAQGVTPKPKPAIQHKSSLFNTPATAAEKITTVVHTGPKIGRNDQCPCQSGRKYKVCCLNKQPQSQAAA